MVMNGITRTSYADYQTWRDDTHVWHMGIDIGPTSNDYDIVAPTDMKITYVESHPPFGTRYSNAGPAYVHATTLKKYPRYLRKWNQKLNGYEYVRAGDSHAYLRFLHLAPDTPRRLNINMVLSKGDIFARIANQKEIYHWNLGRGRKHQMNPHLHLEVLAQPWTSIGRGEENKKASFKLAVQQYCDPVAWLEDGFLSFQKKNRVNTEPILIWDVRKIIELSEV